MPFNFYFYKLDFLTFKVKLRYKIIQDNISINISIKKLKVHLFFYLKKIIVHISVMRSTRKINF